MLACNGAFVAENLAILVTFIIIVVKCCIGNSAGRLSQSRRVSQTKVVRFGDTCQVFSACCLWPSVPNKRTLIYELDLKVSKMYMHMGNQTWIQDLLIQDQD